jgi:hypothetical protein
MKAVFVELPPFARYRGDYLDDESFRLLQDYLMQRPDAGDVTRGPAACASFALPILVAARASEAGCG